MAVTIETAVEQLVASLKEMREQGHVVQAQLGFMKAKLYDESFLLRNDRAQVLKKVTRQLGVSWSMSQIKNATVETTETGETLIVAEGNELQGSVNVNIGGKPSSTAFAGLGVKVEEKPSAPEEVEQDDVGETASNPVQGSEDLGAAFKETGLEGSGVRVEIHKPQVAPYADLKIALITKGYSPVQFIPAFIGLEGDWFVLVQAPEGEGENFRAPWRVLLVNKEGEIFASSDDIHEEVVKLITEAAIKVVGQNPVVEDIADFANQICLVVPGLDQSFTEYFEELDKVGSQQTTESSQANFIERQLEQDPRHNHTFRPLRPVITIDETQTKNSNTQPEGDTAMNDNIPQNLKKNFQSFLNTLGKTPEEREAFLHEFLQLSETYKTEYATFKVSNANLNDIEALFMFAEANEDVSNAIINMAAQSHLKNEGLTPVKSRFTLTGENEDAGPRGSWIGFGAAVVGGGIEMFARDGATVGAAIGTLGAAVGSFIGGELVDKHVEHRLGRYVAAGMLGLGAGSLGSAIGRNLITGVQLPDFIVGAVNGEPVAQAVVSDADL